MQGGGASQQPLRAPPVFNPPSGDEYKYIDTSLDLLQRMVDSLEEDYEAFRIFGIVLNTALLNTLFSVVLSGLVSLVVLVLSMTENTLEQSSGGSTAAGTSTGASGA